MDMHEYDEWERQAATVAKCLAVGYVALFLAAVGAVWFWWGPTP